MDFNGFMARGQAPLQERFAQAQRQAEAEMALSSRQIEAMGAEVQECDQVGERASSLR